MFPASELILILNFVRTSHNLTFQLSIFYILMQLCDTGVTYISSKMASPQSNENSYHLGGHNLAAISFDTIKPYLDKNAPSHLASRDFQYIDHTMNPILLDQYTDPHYVIIDIPLHILVDQIPVTEGRHIAKLHGLNVSSRATRVLIQNHFLSHSCCECGKFMTVLSVEENKRQLKLERERTRMQKFRDDMAANSEDPNYAKNEKHEIIKTQNKLRAVRYREKNALQIKTKKVEEAIKQKKKDLTRIRVQKHRKRNSTCHQNMASAAKFEDESMPADLANITMENNFINKSHSLQSNVNDLTDSFPPPPVTKALAHTIITSACKKMSKTNIEEAGCAVCGQLTPLNQLSSLKSVKNLLHVLDAPGYSRKERTSEAQPLKEYHEVIDHTCKYVCNQCRSSLRRGQMPKYALAKGLWIGDVPDILSSLRLVERMLVAKVRHSCCSIKIASGMRKMKANAIAFQTPIPKVYDVLPPPKEDIEDILAIMFTGPCKPTVADFQRTPFLVRRNHVKLALNWLILNHADYADVKLSDSNLQSYPEDMPPVSVEFKQMESNKTPEGMSVFDIDDEDGTEEGMCSFTVHGLTGEQLNVMSINQIKAKALHHLNTQGKFLAIGHDTHAESIWKNPHLYPQMFPWLFPYGLGGVGSVARLADHEHKKRLLMYHDKRFQVDPNFPFVAFSHEQVKTATTNSFLLAEKRIFNEISGRLLSIDGNALNSLIERMSKNEYTEPVTDAEKQCFQIIKDLDHVSGTVKGSNTSKKWMRNEIWSLVAHCGAPFWYITLSPADVKHPICLYYAGSEEVFEPKILPYDERLRRICNNPVACARFFHFVVMTFITDVLGVGVSHMGLYGHTKAYYGTVEQQGRLSLHLHLLLWIKGNLTPQEMHKLILDPNSDFQQKIVAWIESCQMGEFLTGTQIEVLKAVQENAKLSDYKDPTETLPEAPPPVCSTQCDSCKKCLDSESWWNKFKDIVDDIISRSNIHNCERGLTKNGTRNQKMTYVGCKNNKYGTCKARFPRATFKETQVDPETGALNLKKGEPWVNSFTTYLSYIMRCNTDVTSMWSGTALKAVIVYISDYITKTSLKTHVVFDAIKSIFDKHRDIIGNTIPQKEKARQLITKMVNLLSTKAEMGGPMVCMYLLGNPDHYTSHKFVPFYWKSYVNEVCKVWDPDASTAVNEKVAILKVRNKIIGLSPVYDYMYRPIELDQMCLYDWARRCERKRIPSQISRTTESDGIEDDIEEDNNHNSGDAEFIEQESDTCDSDKWDDKSKGKKLPKNTYCYTKLHPLVETHVTHLNPDRDNVVVNFIGGILPRCDQGDREYYCMTMLTMFKPWRSGRSLKSNELSWDESFAQHTFTARQLQLMNNFNIKYECLDARDDYRASLKAGKEMPFFMYGEENEEESKELSAEDGYVDPYTCGTSLDQSSAMLGTKELKFQKETAEIRSVLRQTGWTNELWQQSNDCNFKPIIPTVNLSGADWKAVLQLQKQKVIDERSKHHKPTESTTMPCIISNPNQVKIIDKSYLERRHYTTQHEVSINSICSKFKLNQEQERAFKLIAHHVVMANTGQLKMYIAGMGGTGKSQVIKAVSDFFTARKEAHRFIVVAPTGSAAALLSGSTYHSVLGINELSNLSENASEKILSQVRTRLQGVDYVFLDEVSMLSCYELYRISCQLSRVFNKLGIPFGGINIIFAGDFAQLPPPIGGENVALYSRTVGQIATSLRSQEEAMGRAVWHQVTTVVILRKNMRQQAATVDDEKLRTALLNMRYKDCTPADIQFLKSRISSLQPGKPSICDPRFRNVSIITARNIQKDEINRLGCIRFAQETGQQVTEFYSEDTLKVATDENNPRRKRSTRKIRNISDDLQEVIWNLPHSTADKQVPGKLSLCLGLPVIIKCNVATELCITNGQEGIVVGWQSVMGSRKQLLLDTLFVKLINPPTTIILNGLPKDVVPLSRTTNTITCKLPDDSKISLSRSQVEVLPNFAMTDFASQGKTRPYNPVDLFNCRSHQAYYTALSRSATAEGTVLIQGFDAKKISGRASRALRQEFRDLELLDEITKLQYESKLPSTVCGERRNTLIHTYREHKGMSYVPELVHKSIRWNKTDPMLDPIEDDINWKILQKSDITSSSLESSDKKKTSFIVAKGTVSLNSTKRKVDNSEDIDKKTAQKKKSKTDSTANNITVYLNSDKRKLDKTEDVNEKTVKRCKSMVSTENNNLVSISNYIPSGFSWHHNSCAYDSALTILHAIWNNDKTKWNAVLRTMNEYIMGPLLNNFTESNMGLMSLDASRDNLRHKLHQLSSRKFAWGRFTGITNLLECLFATTEETFEKSIHCYNEHIEQDVLLQNKNCLISPGSITASSVQSWMSNYREEIEKKCDMCQGNLYRQFRFAYAPPILALDISSRSRSNSNELEINTMLNLTIQFEDHRYKLRGIIYFANFHFTSRIINENGMTWFHDGIATGNSVIYEGMIDTLVDLQQCRGKPVSVVIYTKS